MKHNPVSAGQRFGKLTVVSEAGRATDKHIKWLITAKQLSEALGISHAAACNRIKRGRIYV